MAAELSFTEGGITFTPNPELEKELHKFPVVTTNTEEAARAIAEAARSLAPVDTGAYRDGIIVQSPSPKGVARVLATDQKSSWVEFGTGSAGHEGQYVLRSAVETVGLKFKKGRG